MEPVKSDLFLSSNPADAFAPLADRLRPSRLEDFVGQSHLLAQGKPLRRALANGTLHSMIFWGPPGTGKTTLARLIANYTGAQFLTLSAVTSGIKEIRTTIEMAKQAQAGGRQTVLFVDEVHRFNKSQQDAFLPHVEDGTVILVGATTENPSFELNSALLSRARVYVLKRLADDEIARVLAHALSDKTRGLGERELVFLEEAQALLIAAADGDARRALTLLEIAADLAEYEITEDITKEVAGNTMRRFDKGGEMFYDQISALHKSMRGSDPDATLYWLARM
ncbi:MAG: AAA family ATPase, partial [Gammaproteobacteria bacterium]|nr:AAA family ATPase [Gammaproteobacteria bacterium]